MNKEHRWVIGAGGFIGEVTLMPVARPEVLEVVKRRRPLVFMTHMFVHPLRRGRGWAHDLLEASMTYVDRRGFDVWTYASPYGLNRLGDGRAVQRPGEEALVKLYAAHGFRVVEGAGYRNEMVRRCRVQR